MRFSQIIFTSLFSLALGTHLGFSQSAVPQQPQSSESAGKELPGKPTEQNSPQVKKAVVDVSAPQTPRPAQLVLVRDGELFELYRPENEAEVRAAAEKEAARQAELEQEKLRLVEQLVGGGV